MVFSNIKRVFSCRKLDQKQENKDQSKGDTSSRTATHKKRWSNLSSRASEPTSPSPRKASAHHRLHPAPPDTPTQKKWRLSFRDFFIADDGRFIWVKEIVPATPTTPVCAANLPIYLEMQAKGPDMPSGSSSLSHNPGHDALEALEQLSTSAQYVKSSPFASQTQSIDRRKSAGSGARLVEPISVKKAHTTVRPHSWHPEQTPHVNYPRPLTPLPEQDTPPSSSASSNTSTGSPTPHSPTSVTTASSSSWQTEENAEHPSYEVCGWSSMAMAAAKASVGCCAEVSKRGIHTESTLQAQEAGDGLSTTEGGTESPSPPSTPEHLGRSTIDFTNSPVIIRLWEDALRRQDQNTAALSG